MFIVSDEILERLICCQCKKYLSVKNIKVYPNRGIKCGRCSDPADAGVVSLFGVLAEQALFRCVNRFEGCNQLLSYSDVAAHEKFCIGEKYECPCCIEPFKGTGYEIYMHFKKEHADQLLVNTPEFVLEIDNELTKSYLFRKNDHLFYVNARFSRGEEELILNVMYLGTDKDASKISQMFTLHSLDTKLIYKTKRKSCSTVTGGHLKCFKINLAPVEFSKNVVVCRFDLNTEQVENLVALPKEFKRGEQTLGDRIGDIIKPSVFGKGKYPVTIYNPPTTTASKNIWGLHTAFTSTTTTTTSSIFTLPAFSGSTKITTNHPTFSTLPKATHSFDSSMGNKPSNPLFTNTLRPTTFKNDSKPANTSTTASSIFSNTTQTANPKPVDLKPTGYTFNLPTFGSSGQDAEKKTNMFRFSFGTPVTRGNY